MISEFTILISFLRISNLIMKRTLFSLQKMTRKWILWLLKIQLLLWKWNNKSKSYWIAIIYLYLS